MPGSPALMRKLRKSADSSTYSESTLTEYVCGFADWSAPSEPSSGGSTVQLNPSGASLAMFVAWNEPCTVVAIVPP